MVRIKYRFFVMQALCDGECHLTSRDVSTSINDNIASLYGDIGSARYNIKIVYFDTTSLIFVIRMGREAESEVQFATTLINEIGNDNPPIILRCLRKSGCLRTCLVALMEVLSLYVNNCLSDNSKSLSQLNLFVNLSQSEMEIEREKYKLQTLEKYKDELKLLAT